MSEDVLVPIGDQGGLEFYCPGCQKMHLVCNEHDEALGTLTIGSLVWHWNGSKSKPTTIPSYLFYQDNPAKRCHLFLEDGNAQYCSDSHHQFAGQTVKLEPPAD